MPTPAAPDRPEPAHAAGGTGVRRLSSLPTATAGGVPQARVLRLLEDLAAELAPLHAAGVVHGAIGPDAVGLDRAGRARLLAEPLGERANAGHPEPAAGYAAFEQYTDDPATPCGPWTDIHALSALAHLMIRGEAPPPARQRCVRDDYRPLAGSGLDGYDEAFLAALDRNLSLLPAGRDPTLPAFAAALGIAAAPAASVPEPAADAAAPADPPHADPAAITVPLPAPIPAADVPVSVLMDAPRAEPPGEEPPGGAPTVAAPPAGPARPPVLTMALVGLIVATAIYFWLRGNGADAEDAAVADAGGPPAAQADAQPPAAQPPSVPEASPGSREPADAGAPPPAPHAAPAPGPLAQAEAPAPADPREQDVPPEDQAATPTQDDAPPATQSGSGTAAAQTPEPSPADRTAAADATPAAPAPAAPAAGGEGPDARASATADARPAGPLAGERCPAPLRLDIQPWGEVSVNGTVRGVSPPIRTLCLAPGRYTVTVRNADLPPYSRTLVITAGKPASLSHRFDQ